jgi:hypothetical protein
MTVALARRWRPVRSNKGLAGNSFEPVAWFSPFMRYRDEMNGFGRERINKVIRKAVENELTKLAVDGRADFRVFKQERASLLHFGIKAFAEAWNLCLVGVKLIREIPSASGWNSSFIA